MQAALVLPLALAALTASAQPSQTPAPTTRVFVSGHSLTDLPMPAYLARVADSLGTPVDWNRQYMVGSAIKYRARGRHVETGWAGYAMGDNKEGQGLDVVKELRANPYDALVITEQHGILDSLVSHDTVRHLRHYHERFIAGNPRGRTYFYESWLGIPGRTEVQRWIAYERMASPLWQCVATRINRSLAAEGRTDRIASLPAGLALAELVDQALKGGVEGVGGASPAETIDRLFHDQVHLNPTGAYYIALVVYATVFERSPQGAWAPEGVNAVQAASLQRVAGDFVARYRAQNRPLAGEACAAAMRGPFVSLYVDHMRDDYWSQQQGNALRLAWRRLRSVVTLRWRLWRDDPLAWNVTDERAFWFPAP